MKHETVKNKSEIPPGNAAVGFISDDYSRYVQWTTGANPRGRRQNSGARVLTEHTPDWKKTARGRRTG